MKKMMLLVLVIIALVVGCEDMLDKKTLNKKNELVTTTTIKCMLQPIREYAKNEEFGRFPEAGAEQEGNGTTLLVEVLRDQGYYFFSESILTNNEPNQLVDGWGNPMRYRPWKGKKNKEGAHNKHSYDLWSAGPDGLFETEEDYITNWLKVK
ncbi:MAG: hypothetical protein K8S87_08975 [Planctomycetes bacterium]|nr:hypothetical protein [Planctomycetota bacterium]